MPKHDILTIKDLDPINKINKILILPKLFYLTVSFMLMEDKLMKTEIQYLTWPEGILEDLRRIRDGLKSK